MTKPGRLTVTARISHSFQNPPESPAACITGVRTARQASRSRRRQVDVSF